MKRLGRRGRALVNQELPIRKDDIGADEGYEKESKEKRLFEAAGIDYKMVLDMSEEEREGTLRALLESTGEADNSLTSDCHQLQESNQNDENESLEAGNKTPLTRKVLTRQQEDEFIETVSAKCKTGSSNNSIDEIEDINKPVSSNKGKRNIKIDRSRPAREVRNSGLIKQPKCVQPVIEEDIGAKKINHMFEEEQIEDVSNLSPSEGEDQDSVPDSAHTFQTGDNLAADSNDSEAPIKTFNGEKKNVFRLRRSKRGDKLIKEPEGMTPSNTIKPIDRETQITNQKSVDKTDQDSSDWKLSGNQDNSLMTEIPDSASENSTNGDSGQFMLDFEETQAPDHPTLTHSRSDVDSDESDLPSISASFRTHTVCPDAETQASVNTFFSKEKDIESDDSCTPQFKKLEPSKDEITLNENRQSRYEEAQGCHLHQGNVLASNTDSETEKCEEVDLLPEVDEVPDSQTQSSTLRKEAIFKTKLQSSEHMLADNSENTSKEENLINQNKWSWKMQYWPPMFLPNHMIDPDCYTQVIKLMFNIYHRQLRHSLQRPSQHSAAWTKPVKSGLHEQDCLKAKWRSRCTTAESQHLFEKGLRSLRKNKDAYTSTDEDIDDDPNIKHINEGPLKKRPKKNNCDTPAVFSKQNNCGNVKNKEIIEEDLTQSSDNEQVQPPVKKRSLRTTKQEIFSYAEMSTQGEDGSDAQISDSNWEPKPTKKPLQDASKSDNNGGQKESEVDVHDWITRKPPMRSYERTRGIKTVKRKTEKRCRESNLSLKYGMDDDREKKNNASVYDFLSDCEGEISDDKTAIPPKRLKIKKTKIKSKDCKIASSVSDDEDVNISHECVTHKNLKKDTLVKITSTLSKEDESKKMEDALNSSQGVQASGLPVSQGSNFLLDVNGDMYGTQFPRGSHKDLYFKRDHKKRIEDNSELPPSVTVEGDEDSNSRDVSTSSKESNVLIGISDSKVISDTESNTKETLFTEKIIKKGKTKNLRKRKLSRTKSRIMADGSSYDIEIDDSENTLIQNIESGKKEKLVSQKIQKETRNVEEYVDLLLANENGNNNSKAVKTVVCVEETLLDSIYNPSISSEADVTVPTTCPDSQKEKKDEGLCPICEQMFPLKELEEHASTCGEEHPADLPPEPKTEKCLVCSADITTGKMRVHQMHCITQFSPEHGTRKTRYRTGTSGFQGENDIVEAGNHSKDE